MPRFYFCGKQQQQKKHNFFKEVKKDKTAKDEKNINLT